MKKIIVSFLMLSLIVSAGFAATAPKVTAKPAATGSSNGLRVGFIASTPTVKFNINENMNMQVGLGLSSSSGSSTFGIVVAGGSKIAKVSGNDIYTGSRLNYSSSSGSSSFTIAWDLGVDVMLNSALEVGLYISPISYSSTSFGGASSTSFSILSGGVISAHLYI